MQTKQQSKHTTGTFLLDTVKQPASAQTAFTHLLSPITGLQGSGYAVVLQESSWN